VARAAVNPGPPNKLQSPLGEERFADLSDQELAENLDVSDPEQSLLVCEVVIVLRLFLQII
jgi:hypothetical protein